ncbi:MAG: hypothetical protein ISS48_04400 [Candidatus Aenigmarchaeota archaeon]|nr:hypothetical protein [Candidatus Aenigmarchaeota archaeon]
MRCLKCGSFRAFRRGCWGSFLMKFDSSTTPMKRQKRIEEFSNFNTIQIPIKR